MKHLLLLTVLLLPLNGFADSITARLTIQGVSSLPQIELEAIVTLEPNAGPFWWPWYTDFLSQSNGFVLTSLTGTFNGMPAVLADLPGKPSWAYGSPLGLTLGYVRWQAGGSDYWAFSEVTQFVATGLPPGGGFPVAPSLSVVPAPEPTTALMVLAGLLAGRRVLLSGLKSDRAKC